MNAPKQYRSDISNMFESSSFDMPSPTGWPPAFSFGAALRTFSHVFGATPDVLNQKLLPVLDRVRDVVVREAEVRFVFGLYVDF